MFLTYFEKPRHTKKRHIGRPPGYTRCCRHLQVYSDNYWSASNRCPNRSAGILPCTCYFHAYKIRSIESPYSENLVGKE